MMIAGLLIGIILNFSFLSWVNGYGWEWAYRFPVGWGGAGLNAMAVFFHEIGHTVPAWLYGYVALPGFDFSYGGGMTWIMGGQVLPLMFACDAALLWVVYALREHRGLQIAVIGLLLFHLVTGLTDTHLVVIDFAGPLAEIGFAGFFLYRAWLNLAPRGAGERWLNAIIGWGMMIRVYVQTWGLLFNEAMRQAYLLQKGSHGFGDFDKIADRMALEFTTVVWIWFLAAFAATLLPVVVHFFRAEEKI